MNNHSVSYTDQDKRMAPDSSLLSSSRTSATYRSSLSSSSLTSSLAPTSSFTTTSLKVVIVGNEGVGKTSFVRRFVAEELGIAVDNVTPTTSSLSSSPSSPSPLHHHRWRRREGPPEMISTGVPQRPEVGLDIYELELPIKQGGSTGAATGTASPLSEATTPLGSSNNSNCSISSSRNLQRLAIWDFSGKAESLHAVQEIFFTPQTLYIVVWDMAAKDITPIEYERATAGAASGHSSSRNNNHSRRSSKSINHNHNSSSSSSINNISNNNIPSHSHSYLQPYRSIGSSAFKLGYDSDSEDSDCDYYDDYDVGMYNEEELRRTKRTLERDIDKKVQYWIDRIQAIAPGATILPMATHMDRLVPKNHLNNKDTATVINKNTTTSTTEKHRRKGAKKRCRLLKERLTSNEARKVECLERRCRTISNSNRSNSYTGYDSRPNFQFGSIQKDGQVLPHAVAVGCNRDEGREDDDDEDDDMSLGFHTKDGCKYEEGKSFATVRDFVLTTARAVAARGEECGSEELCHSRSNVTSDYNNIVGIGEPSTAESLVTDTLRDERQKMWRRSKVIQTSYFTKKFCTENHHQNGLDHSFPGDQEYTSNNSNVNDTNAVLTALDSLHRSGELCYFGGDITSSGRQHQCESSDTRLLSEFVVLDPSWLIESMNFILQYAEKFVEKTTNSRTTMASSESSKQQRATNCPTIEKDEVRWLWKARSSTKQGLGLAEHYFQFQSSDEDDGTNGDVADQVFEFIQCLLVQHGVFIPLSYQKSGSRHFFLPGLLRQKSASNITTTDSSQTTLSSSSSSILPGLSHQSNLLPINEKCADSHTYLGSADLHAACHGLVFVDTAPQTLMERVIVHTIKSLGEILTTNCGPRVEAKEIYCWKDYFRLKLKVDVGDIGEEQTVELNSFLLEAPEGGTHCRMVTCESILVSYLQGCHDSESRELWRQTCSSLREAMQNALDEMPGLEYREEGICPECVRKKPVSEMGTWTFANMRSAVDSKESFIQCRYGHRIETKLDGLIHCQLVEAPEPSLANHDILGKRPSSMPKSAASNSKPRPQTLTTSTSTTNQLSCITSSPKRTKRRSVSALKNKQPDQTASNSKRHSMNTMNTKNNTFRVSFSNDRKEMLSSGALMEREPNEIVALLLNKCEAKMKRSFFKKSNLSLDNLNLTECQVPTKELSETKLGRHLQSLSLAHNKLETLPKSLVYCLPNLRYMNLSHCLIYELPKRWNLPLLKKLDVSHNLLIDFPEENVLLGLLELEELNLSGNKITKIRVSANPQILRKLKRLDLSSNELISFPTDLNNFTALKSLDLQSNEIDDEKRRKHR